MSAEQRRQQAYDRVVAHLRTQGRPSLDAKGSCAYRGEDGRKCAMGIFIPDATYNPAIEGTSVISILHYLPAEVAAAGAIFLDDMQMLHDVSVTISTDGSFHGPSLERALERISDKWRVEYSPPAAKETRK